MIKNGEVNKMEKSAVRPDKGRKAAKMLSNLYTEWRECIRRYVMPYKWEYLFGGIFTLLIIFSAMYSDFLATFRDGINFWYALFEGHPLSYYSYAAAISGSTPNRVITCGAAYDFTIYAFFAIWNFPAWLYERISGNYAESSLACVMWAKLMLPVIAMVTARGMRKILEFISGSDRDTAAMIFAYSFSGILIMAAYSVGQYDIIGVMFAVYGVYYFLRKDYKRFYLYFGAAITCKYFAIFLFVCLVLLHEKRILYIIRNIAAGCYLVVIEKLLFSFGKSYASLHPTAEKVHTGGSEGVVGTLLLSSRVQYLFHLKTFMGVDTMSVFIFIVALILVYCYLQKREETYHFYYTVIYIAFCINAVFILFTASTPYWAIVMAPYMILLIYCRTENRKINISLELIGIGSFLVWHMAREPYLFYSVNCEGMLLYYLLGKPYFYTRGLTAVMGRLVEEGGILVTPINMLRSVFYACMLVLLIINFPAFNKGENDFAHRQEEVGMRGLLAFRMVCMVGVLLLPLAGYVAQVAFGEYFRNLQTENQLLNDILPHLIN
ncbi:MAG: hypothetical protein NC489_23520 [Ruminococcus flavefaciens]|nr:hypothetical protein [Ruminococcus flavefaciens]